MELRNQWGVFGAGKRPLLSGRGLASETLATLFLNRRGFLAGMCHIGSALQ